MRCPTLAPLVFVLVVGACESSHGDTVASNAPDKPVKLAGVFPDQFKCESIATLETIGQLLGGTAQLNTSPSTVPRGVPQPCSYQIVTPNGAEYWTFDIDCRPTYKKTADALFDQYTQGSTDLVTAYNAVADAGIKPTDAGVEVRAPEPATPVDVGAKGLDHHGRGLIFIDDDAPCYVRIVGTDGVKRLELAKLLAKNLTFANAPMTPRAFP